MPRLTCGRSDEEDAAGPVVADAAIKIHINWIVTNLQLQSRVQAVVLGYESGLVVPGASGRPTQRDG